MKSRLLQILFIIIHHPTERHSLPSSTPPNPAPCQNIHTHYTPNSGVARRGRAREGETAFATMSASPSRNPAHAKVSPPGKKLSVRRHRLSAQERPSDARHCTISGTIFSLFLSIIQLHVYYKEHTSKLLTLNSESVILWSS